MSSIKGCIFDLDGVIVDTAKYHYLAWSKISAELGFKFTLEDNERLKGVSRTDSLDILLKIGGLNPDADTKNKLASKKNKFYLEYVTKMDRSELLPGVESFILQLKNKGIKIALGSASKNSMLILNNLKITDYFDAIIDGNKVSLAKPNPEVFLLGAKELNLQPKECVVFEDSEAGIIAAINGRMFSIGVGNPKILYRADKVISGFQNLSLDILKFDK